MSPDRAKPALHPIEASHLHARRERVFLVLAGLFLGSLTMLNILGITRFIDMSFEVGSLRIPLVLAVGVLPYPITFLCTDFISEIYGRARANAVVLTGLLLNAWVMLILWIGGSLPGFETIDPETGRIATDAAGRLPVFFEVRQLAFGAVIASMLAYLAAQLCDVWTFHFWKRLTRGRHLWLRNCGSTVVSQMVDSIAVITITYLVGGLAGVIREEDPLLPQLALLVATGYAFKFACAVLDTPIFYLGVRWLSRWLRIDPTHEHRADVEELQLDNPAPPDRVRTDVGPKGD